MVISTQEAIQLAGLNRSRMTQTTSMTLLGAGAGSQQFF